MQAVAVPSAGDVVGDNLTTLVPVYNEAGSIANVLREFHQAIVKTWGGRLVVCEDGSTDGTPEVLAGLKAELNLEVVSGPFRKGYARAVRDGLNLVQSPYIFFTDSDGQYNPADFGRLQAAIEGADMVIGCKTQRQEKLYRTVLSRGFHVLTKALTGVPLRDMDCGFRVLRKEIVNSVLPDVKSLPYSFWAEFSILAYRKGFRIAEVPVDHRLRAQGGSSIYTWNRLPWILVLQVRGLLGLAIRLKRAQIPGLRSQSPRPAHSS